MKTILDIPFTKVLDIYPTFGKSSFIRINSNEHEGCNAHCFETDNVTYYENRQYFIPFDVEVFETKNKK